jgi:hypothetical protein
MWESAGSGDCRRTHHAPPYTTCCHRLQGLVAFPPLSPPPSQPLVPNHPGMMPPDVLRAAVGVTPPPALLPAAHSLQHPNQYLLLPGQGSWPRLSTTTTPSCWASGTTTGNAALCNQPKGMGPK